MFVACWGGNPVSTRPAFIAAREEVRASELLRREQFIHKVEENPALRQVIMLEAERKFEAQQVVAFQKMEDTELQRIYRMPNMFQQIEAHKRFWAWRKQAVLELQQLREAQRLSGEHRERITDTFISAIEKVTWEPVDTGDSYNTITLKYTPDTYNILPITTPAAFALKYQDMSDSRPWFRSRNEEMVSPLSRPPGRRFSLCEMPQIQCDPKHYRWLQESVKLTLVKDSSYSDQTPRKGFGLWTQLARLMWKGEIAINDIVKKGDRLQLR